MREIAFPAAWLLFFWVSLQIPGKGGPSNDSKPVRPAELEATIRRYFVAIGGFQEGDLVAQSQVRELQIYLRKTRGHSAATHPKLLGRVLPDASRLARLFYSGQGAEVLRNAANKLGGYEYLDRLSRTHAGRAQLNAAIKSDSPGLPVELLPKLAKKVTKTARTSKESPSKASLIYTVDELVTAISATTKDKPRAAAQEENGS